MRLNHYISYIFHPIVFPFFGTLFYFFVLPKYISERQISFVLITIAVGTILLPIVLLFFLKNANMISSFSLSNIEERKYPLLLFSIIGFLIGKLLLKLTLVNDLAVFIFAGSLGMLVIYAFLWVEKKVSIHALGIGGFVGFMLYLSYSYSLNLLLFIALGFVLFGIIANARLQLKAHNAQEVVYGFVIGVGLQLLFPNLLFII